MIGEARRGLRGGRGRYRRVLVTALGIALAAAMLSAAVVVADGLGLGFQRSAAAAGLPDLIVRFNPQPRAAVLQRIRALPDVAGAATRLELDDMSIGYGTRSTTHWPSFRASKASDALPVLIGVFRPRPSASNWSTHV